jgi:hypothetical protein
VIHALTTCFLDDIVHFSTEIGHIMKSGRLARRLAATAGMGAIIAMGTLTACGQGEEAPETTTPTPTTTEATTAPPATPAPTTPGGAPVEPTEKAPRISPGPNPFSPPVIAPPAPTGIPGDN